MASRMSLGQWLGILKRRATFTCFLNEPRPGIHGFLTRRTRGPLSMSSKATYLMLQGSPPQENAPLQSSSLNKPCALLMLYK